MSARFLHWSTPPVSIHEFSLLAITLLILVDWRLGSSCSFHRGPLRPLTDPLKVLFADNPLLDNKAPLLPFTHSSNTWSSHLIRDIHSPFSLFSHHDVDPWSFFWRSLYLYYHQFMYLVRPIRKPFCHLWRITYSASDSHLSWTPSSETLDMSYTPSYPEGCNIPQNRHLQPLCHECAERPPEKEGALSTQIILNLKKQAYLLDNLESVPMDALLFLRVCTWPGPPLFFKNRRRRLCRLHYRSGSARAVGWPETKCFSLFSESNTQEISFPSPRKNQQGSSSYLGKPPKLPKAWEM